MTRGIRQFGAAVTLGGSLFVAACGGGADGGLKEVQRVKSGDLDIVLLADDGALNQGKETFVIEFRKVDGTLQDVGAVGTSANMPMPGMTMPGSVQVSPGDVPGRYRASGDFGMAGGWQFKIDWNGPAGQGSASFDGTVQ